MALLNLPLENKIFRESNLTLIGEGLSFGPVYLKEVSPVGTVPYIYREDIRYVGLNKVDRDIVFNFIQQHFCNTPFIRTYCLFTEPDIVYNCIRLPNTLKETLKNDLKYYLSFSILEVKIADLNQ